MLKLTRNIEPSTHVVYPSNIEDKNIFYYIPSKKYGVFA